MPKHILLIMADQLSRRALGCYGNRDVASPAIDALARSGITMPHAYTTCPLCLPARSALGLVRLALGVAGHGLHLPGGFVVGPRRLLLLRHLRVDARLRRLGAGLVREHDDPHGVFA